MRRPDAGSVEFAGAIAAPDQAPPARLPQVAIAGRSNVGKSTLLNRLVGRKSIARTSKRPGRTQQINFFRVDDSFLIADLPGYGFAKAPEAVRERWGPLIESYLSSTPELLGIVLLIDARRGVGSDDVRLVEYLAALRTPALFVLTKADKLNRQGRQKAVREARAALGVDEEQLLVTSAKTGLGVATLWHSLRALVDEAGAAR
ncbi:MAG: ribosome biogenesis GTP-binding protein YihA/YsxC [Gemmatimonadota bacterium]